jgi:hypothetical protein
MIRFDFFKRRKKRSAAGVNQVPNPMFVSHTGGWAWKVNNDNDTEKHT